MTDYQSAASILIVDDRPANLLALEGILDPLGHRVVRAGSGEEALKRILGADFALILMDVQMPGLDGFQTATLIKDRERSKHIPIIFLTAINKEAMYVFKGYEHGAVDYLLKPFDAAVLRSKVSVFVELWVCGERLKEHEAALRDAQRSALERQAERRYHSIIDSMPHCVWAVDPDGQIFYGNREWVRYAGLPPVLGPQHFFEFLHADDREQVKEQWNVAIATGQPFRAEYRLRRHDGAERWHLGRAVPERPEPGEGGQLSSWVLSSTDVDEEKRAHQQADVANRAKDEFLATVSHELRNPLNAILGWMRMLRTGKLDEAKQARALATIERNTESQLELVEDILDVSRIITGKLRIELKPVSLSQVAQAAVDTVRPSAEARNIELVQLYDAEADQASGDPDRLQQVVWNLLTNAIKFTPRGGRVELRLERADSHVQLRVIDSGKGIAADFLPHVFERFRQAENASTRTVGGLGLGLALVRHLVEAHGGSVSVASPGLGLGATFVVRLPLRAVQAQRDERIDEEGPRRRRRSSLADAPALDGLRVLVVDDEPDARELLALVLGESGAEVTTASTAEEALQTLIELKPDVLVSDLGLPKEDGIALIKKIRLLGAERGGAVPAAALTGFARAEDGQRAIAAGFQVHVPKPVEPAELVTLVARLAGREQIKVAHA